MHAPASVIFGCAGPVLKAEERRFFAQVRPAGFILFSRNVRSACQLSDLIAELKSLAGHDHVLILIDQEGGRVQRIKPPMVTDMPSAARLAAVDRVRSAYRLIGAELGTFGINVNCAPVVDVPVTDGHDIIGDRAFSENPRDVADYGRQAAEGLLESGILPVIKHLPGHGRARTDSHHALPRVKTPLEILEETDFLPFRALSDLPLGMTAHIVYEAVDPRRPVTLSPEGIAMIRETIGFGGVLMTDDLSMKALKGAYARRARQALEAGCDLVLHCNGRLDQMQKVAEGVCELSAPAQARLKKALEMAEFACQGRLSVGERENLVRHVLGG